MPQCTLAISVKCLSCGQCTAIKTTLRLVSLLELLLNYIKLVQPVIQDKYHVNVCIGLWAGCTHTHKHTCFLGKQPLQKPGMCWILCS